MSESTQTNGHAEAADPNLPPWLPRISLENAVHAQIGDFEKILSVTPQPTSSGDNYSALMVRLLVEVELLGKWKQPVNPLFIYCAHRRSQHQECVLCAEGAA